MEFNILSWCLSCLLCVPFFLFSLFGLIDYFLLFLFPLRFILKVINPFTVLLVVTLDYKTCIPGLSKWNVIVIVLLFSSQTMQGLLNFYLISFQKKKRRRESLPTIDLLKCFYSVDDLTIITDISTFRPRTPYFILGLSKIQENKKRTEIRLACRILGKFIKQPTSFVGTS